MRPGSQEGVAGDLRREYTTEKNESPELSRCTFYDNRQGQERAVPRGVTGDSVAGWAKCRTFAAITDAGGASGARCDRRPASTRGR